MKKLTVFCLIILCACGKKEDKKTSTPTPNPKSGTILKMKANGTAVELFYSPIWTFDSSPKKYGLGITEDKTGTAAPERKLMSIRIQESDFVVGGTHTVGAGNNNEFIYMANHANTKGQYKASKNFPKSHGTFTLTKIKVGSGTLKNFYGTFSGTLINMDGDSIVITEGQIIE